MNNMRAICFILVLVATATAQTWPEPYAAHFHFLGHYPYDEPVFWGEDVQGVTHDDANWYFTQTFEEDGELFSLLWQIPVKTELNREEPPSTARSWLIPEQLHSNGFNHFGDLDFYRGYILIAVEGAGPYPALAIFKTTPAGVEYLGYDEMTGQMGGSHAGWCAVDVDGAVYTCNWGETSRLQKYALDWQALENEDRVSLTFINDIPRTDENGAPLVLLETQGGDFTPDGSLLYLSTGYITESCDGEFSSDVMESRGGIHVLDVKTWRRIRHSANCATCDDIFKFEFHPDLSGGCEEPEGLTIWDLDDGRAPGILGQLHVILLDNDWPDKDDINFAHYTSITYVDANAAMPGDGRRNAPLQTISAACSFAWDGSQIKIGAGRYAERPTFSKMVRVSAWKGVARISARVSIAPPGSINLKGGIVKIF